MKTLLTILIVLVTTQCNSQINYREWREWIDSAGYNQCNDSLVKVEILLVWKNKKDGLTYVKLKNMETKQKVWTEGCECVVPYRKGDLVFIQRKLFRH